MTWKQIKQPEDPDWVEWHKEVMSPKWGRSQLRVWQGDDEYFRTVMIDQFGNRAVTALEARTIEAAKLEAEKWARGE